MGSNKRYISELLKKNKESGAGERMKTYDNYDYEEAYNKQLENLEEWEYERLLKEGKVDSLYRTTTIKSKNKKSGRIMVESMIYPSFNKRADVPKTKRRRESKPSQKNLNDRNSRRYLIRLANINFGEGDLWCTFGWDDNKLPENEERAMKDIGNFIRRINRKRKKQGRANVKYIYVLAFDGYKRPHFHLVMEGGGIDRDELEGLWGKCSRPNTKRIKPDNDYWITGLATYVSNNPHGRKRWCSSRNLDKPDKPTRSYSKFRKRTVEKMVKDYEELKEQMEKVYEGYRFLDAEVKYNGVTAAFYIYARMVRN